MSIELTGTQALALSRLRRCARWVEVNRVQGTVILMGARPNGFNIEEMPFSEDLLNELLRLGLIECESSPRLTDGNPNRLKPGVVETVQKYWRAL